MCAGHMLRCFPPAAHHLLHGLSRKARPRQQGRKSHKSHGHGAHHTARPVGFCKCSLKKDRFRSSYHEVEDCVRNFYILPPQKRRIGESLSTSTVSMGINHSPPSAPVSESTRLPKRPCIIAKYYNHIYIYISIYVYNLQCNISKL